MNIVAIIKNEGLYLEEWIRYHKDQGFLNFYLYDNGSEDDTPYILKNIKGVHYHYWPKSPGQLPAYYDFIVRNRTINEWTAFIDVDEFIWVQSGRVWDYMQRAKGNAILLNWYIFGSSNHESYEARPVLERFIMRSSVPNPHVKSIIKPFAYKGPIKDPHYIPVLGATLDGALEYVQTPGHFHHLDKEPLLRINHYVTKSKEECRKKCALHRSDTGGKRDFEQYFYAHDVNEVYDETIIFDNRP